MNSTNTVKLIYSIDTLTYRFVDYANVIAVPIACTFSLTTNTFNLFVLLQPSIKDGIYRYMLAMCISDFYTLLSTMWLCLIRCGALCSAQMSYSYSSKIYEQYLFLYFQNVSLFTTNIMDLHIAISRLMSFSKDSLKYLSKNLPFKFRILIVLIIGLILNFPNYILSRDISNTYNLVVRNNDTNQTSLYPIYQVVNNKIGNDPAGKVFLFILGIMRKLFLLVLLTVINVIMAIKFIRHMRKKRKLKPDNEGKY